MSQELSQALDVAETRCQELEARAEVGRVCSDRRSTRLSRHLRGQDCARKESESRALALELQQKMSGGLDRDQANALRAERDAVQAQLRDARAEAEKQRFL